MFLSLERCPVVLLPVCLFLLMPTMGLSQYAPSGFSGYLLDDTNLQRYDDAKSGVWQETFESPGVSWRYLFRESKVQVTQHNRTHEVYHSGQQSEMISVDFYQSGYIFLGHYVGYPVLCNDSQPSLWLRATRPGITLGMVVVLPKSLRPDTETPVTLLLAGSTYERVGDWEQLVFPGNLEKQLRETVQAIRSEHKLLINTEGAYIRQLVLLMEGNQGNCTLWVDDLQIKEVIPRSLEQLQQDERKSTFNPVNLLSFRIAAAKIPVFYEDENGSIAPLGREPFEIDQQQVLAKEQNLFRNFLPSLSLNNKGFGKTGQLIEQYTIFSESRRSSRIGQAGFQFNQNQTGAAGNIAAVQYAQDTSGSEGGGSAAVSTAEPEIESTVIFGSGTLASSADAPEASYTRTSNKPIPALTFSGKVLMFDQSVQFGVRAIEYQGEPLSFLKELRFNTVWLKEAPSRALLEEAEKLDLWIISPPPVGTETLSSGAEIPYGNVSETDSDLPVYFNNKVVDPIYDRVLVWDVGANYSKSSLASLQKRTMRIRDLDQQRHRPILCHAESGVNDITLRNNVDVLLEKRQPLLTSLDLNSYSQWLQSYQNFAVPLWPFWNTVQTQPDPMLMMQCRFFGAVDELPGLISYEQMRQQIRMSIRQGCHGLIFASNSPLTDLDHETQYRAAALELLNLELLLIDPWFSGGNVDAEPVRTNIPTLDYLVSRTDRTVLAMPFSREEYNQYVMGQGAGNHLELILSAREGYTSELLVPGSVRKISSKRQAGGKLIELDEVGMNSIFFLTQSDLHNQIMVEKAPQFGPRMAELAIQLAKMRVDIYEQTIYQLKYLQDHDAFPMLNGKPIINIPAQDLVISQARKSILQAEEYYRNKDDSQAYLEAERATREIRMNERRFWLPVTKLELCHPVLPVSVSFNTLPIYLDTYQKITGGKLRLTGPDKIEGGNMETPDAWGTGSWTRSENKKADMEIHVSQDTSAFHSGQFGLLMSVTKTNPQSVQEMESPSVWVETSFPVNTGEMICVHGWINIPEEIIDSVDGMMIDDDQGGEALALRFKKTAGWQQFAFYRYAGTSGKMTVRFSLYGYGNVMLDDISAHTVQ